MIPETVLSPVDQMFPRLTPEQIARIAAHGRVRQVQKGEVLIEAGERSPHFYVITAGHIEVIRPLGSTEELVVVCEAGMFSGEVNMVSGRHALIRARARDVCEVIEVDMALPALQREDLRAGLAVLAEHGARNLRGGIGFQGRW